MRKQTEPEEIDRPMSLSEQIELVFNVKQGNEVETTEGILSTYIL